MGKEAAKKVGYSILVIITIIIAIITIIGGLYPNPNHSYFLVYIAIGMPAVLLFNLLIAIYWSFRWRFWAIVPIIAILSNWAFLSAMFQFNSTNKSAYDLKVATYNVHSFNNDYSGYSAKKIANFMQDSNVGILCMQEYSSIGNFNLDSLNLTFNEYYTHSIIPRNNKGTRVAIYSKYPIINSKYISFKDSHNCAMYCDIKHDNTTIRIFNLHLQSTNFNQDIAIARKQNIDASGAIDIIESSLLSNAKKRTSQASFIAKLVQKSPYPVILCGDFNAMPSTYEYHTIAQLLSDGFIECGSGYGYTYRNLLKLMRIDYVFTSSKIIGKRYYSASKVWSDHNPVLMEMSLK
ncbi:MAG: endonuclease/exonuclease/phosphatase family protein [Muribaculaceae bacterium]